MATITKAPAGVEQGVTPFDEAIRSRFHIIDGIGMDKLGHEGEDLGYHWVPREALSQPEPLHNWLAAYGKGVGKAAIQLIGHNLGYTGSTEWPHPQVFTEQINGHDRPILHTPRTTVNDRVHDEPENMVMFVGLMESELGTARNLHEQVAIQYPGRDIYTLIAAGVNVTGSPLSPRAGYNQTIEATAEENLALVRNLTGDTPSVLTGTSKGTCDVTHLAGINLESASDQQLTIAGINLLSPAVGARNVPWDKFNLPRLADASDEALVSSTTREFFLQHMPEDAFRMGLRHPEEAGESTVAILNMLLDPRKFIPRAFAIAGHVRAAQQGIEYDTLEKVSLEYGLRVFGGELDNLYQETAAQYIGLMRLSEKVVMWVARGVGHALTLDSKGVAAHMVKMEEEPEVTPQKPLAMAA